jgi:hypothetical protein
MLECHTGYHAQLGWIVTYTDDKEGHGRTHYPCRIHRQRINTEIHTVSIRACRKQGSNSCSQSGTRTGRDPVSAPLWGNTRWPADLNGHYGTSSNVSIAHCQCTHTSRDPVSSPLWGNRRRPAEWSLVNLIQYVHRTTLRVIRCHLLWQLLYLTKISNND